ncbi:hypothetical protein Tdes44962_MAKER02593 [Teratosphaeria destructans]|uniref:Uncharacterized protein n=1 Tax=Teratosphaeria destructans TaxID=418781 RepID=A0A9W7STG2_9PEZI|nr:hypothetical protein Tdes44962_MAKER02593 [Teratosphaeria destructans]
MEDDHERTPQSSGRHRTFPSPSPTSPGSQRQRRPPAPIHSQNSSVQQLEHSPSNDTEISPRTLPLPTPPPVAQHDADGDDDHGSYGWPPGRPDELPLLWDSRPDGCPVFTRSTRPSDWQQRPSARGVRLRTQSDERNALIRHGRRNATSLQRPSGQRRAVDLTAPVTDSDMALARTLLSISRNNIPAALADRLHDVMNAVISMLTDGELEQELVAAGEELWTIRREAGLDGVVEPWAEEVARILETLERQLGTLRHARGQSSMVANSGDLDGQDESSITRAQRRANFVRDVQLFDQRLADLDPGSDGAADYRALRAAAARFIASMDAEDGILRHPVQGFASEAERARFSDRRSVAEQLQRQSSSREDRRPSGPQEPRRRGRRSRGRSSRRRDPGSLSPPSEWTVVIAEVPDQATSPPRRRRTRRSAPENVYNFTLNPSTKA